MAKFKHRDLATIRLFGERVDFIADNDRLEDRVSKISNERHVIDAMIRAARPDDVVWDVGACLGIHTYTTAKHLTDGEVVAFEPMPTNRGVLIDNMTVNHLDNVEVRREALSDEDGTADFAIREGVEAGYGRHSLDIGDYDKLRSIEVPTRRGNGLAVGGEVSAPNIVKIDVEGAGPLVIEGMRDVLARDSCRHVFLETHEPNPVQPSHEDFGYTEGDIREMLADLGFEVETLEKDYHLHAVKCDTDASPTPAVDVEVAVGDIAEQTADALVSSAGTSLRMGTGVAGSIREAASDEFYRDVLTESPAELGSAVATPAYDLDADYVVHAVGMPHYGRGRATPETIREAVRAALRTADDLGCTSVAVPAVGCGLGGVPLSTGAEVIFDELAAHDPSALESVLFVAYTEEEREAIGSVAP